VIAVLQSLDQFDPAINQRFITFAYPRIRGEMIDYLRRLDPLPRRRRAKVARVREAGDRLAQSLGETPAERQLAENMGITEHDLRVIQCDGSRRHRSSLDEVLDTDGGLTLVDLTEDKTALESFEAMEWKDVRMHLETCADALTDRDRTILELYFGEGLTLSDIGAFLGISEARVSQLRKAALGRLQNSVDPVLRTAA